MEVLRSLEDLLGGDRKITWLVEDSMRPSADIMSYMHQKRANGRLFHATRTERERLHSIIRSELAAGRHVALMPGRPTQPSACLSDVSADLLHFLLAEYPHAVLPIYAGMYTPRKMSLVTSAAPYEKLQVRVMPRVPAGAGQADAVFAAWMEASVDQLDHLVADSTDTLSQALLRSLLGHPHAVIIDGVDDSRMSYRNLLFVAAPLARYLRKQTASKRLGIILPPGKLSIIANVACILAGITPVNIDYSYDRAAFKRVISRAELTRFITEHCFVDMQRQFPWPPQRDILFIDEVLAPSGYRILSRWKLLNRFVTPGRIIKWIHTPAATPLDEALAVFTPAEDGAMSRGALLHHRAVLTGAMLAMCRFGLGEGARVLSALPFHHREGLLAGLIHPLLMGLDIITYPLPSASKRLCHLARLYAPSLAVFTPEQTREVLDHAHEGDFAATTCFHVAGRVPVAMAKQVFERHHIFLCECYVPLQAAMPAACNMSPIAPERAIPSGAPGTAGMPLPGVAFRITDMDHPDTPLPLSSPGLVWVKGPGISPDRPRQGSSAWQCTGDVGCLRSDGLLVIGGPRARFSKVQGEIISHEEIEQLMLQILRVEEEPGKPRLAIVGLPDAEGGDERIVLLSTVHSSVGPHDVLTLRYALTNAHHPSHWAPNHIVALRAIPTLPGGRVDYSLCLALARKVLGVNPS